MSDQAISVAVAAFLTRDSSDVQRLVVECLGGCGRYILADSENRLVCPMCGWRAMVRDWRLR